MAAACTRWGIFGAGKIAHDFVVALKTLPENEHKVVAVAARSLERSAEFADRHNVEKAYRSYEELARDSNVEVVYVSTIHPQHKPLCILALNNGKHVLCEKPMTMNLKDTKELFDLAKTKGLFIMEVSDRCRVWMMKSYPGTRLLGVEKGKRARFTSFQLLAIFRPLSTNGEPVNRLRKSCFYGRKPY